MRTPWAQHEIELLEQHISDPDWFDAVWPALRHRTASAVQSRMKKLRCEQGFQERSMAWYNANAVSGSQLLAAATLSAGMWA